MSKPSFHLFEVFGVELEYMIVDARTLSVLPITDQVLHALAGQFVSDIDLEDGITWSNELPLHVIELKATRPVSRLAGWAATFQRNVERINELLAPLGGRLMPSAMHPWMDPYCELRLWPHEFNAVYETFNRIFDCRGHGWANLQSAHLNLPFANDEEFGRLHAAVRLLLPILPALSASSPVVEGKVTGLLDNRLEVYRHNSAKIPSIAGLVIPEPLFTRKDYEEQILARLYRDIAPYDPDCILRNEWLNARGAIARFTRSAIEIRVLDVQECPQADLAILALVVAVLRLLATEQLSSSAEQRRYPTEPLHELLLAVIRDAEEVEISDPDYLRLLGLAGQCCCMVGELWQSLFERVSGAGWLDEEFHEPLRRILRQGPLARRLLRRISRTPSREKLVAVYGQLCACVSQGRMLL